MSGPRIAPGSRREVGIGAWAFSHAAGRVLGTNPPNIFLTLGRGRTLFWAWMIFAGRLMPGGRLRRRESELVILRVAGARGCDYELVQHRTMGRRAGLDADEIERAIAGDASGFSDREQLLLTATGELLADRDVGEETWARMRAEFDERLCIEILMLASHYDMLATVLTTLRVAPDRKTR